MCVGDRESTVLASPTSRQRENTGGVTVEQRTACLSLLSSLTTLVGK